LRSHALDPAVELDLGDRLIHNHVLIGAHRHVSAGIELGGLLSIDVAETLLLLVVGDLSREESTHCCSSGWLESTTLLGRKSE
jgi:hypothetical protein